MISIQDYSSAASTLAGILAEYLEPDKVDGVLSALDARLREGGVLDGPSGQTGAVDFTAFWKAYDIKVDKQASERLWNRMSKRDRIAAMEYIPLYKEAQPDKRFRKQPARFLRTRAWEDEIIGSRLPSASQNDTVIRQHDGGFDGMENFG